MKSTDFRFVGEHPDDQAVYDLAGNFLGTVKYKRIPHLRLSAWEATHANGEHRAVHEHQLQAAKALAWDGTGYPFPLQA